MDRARLKLPLRVIRYYLSKPSFDIEHDPAVLTVILERPWRRAPVRSWPGCSLSPWRR